MQLSPPELALVRDTYQKLVDRHDPQTPMLYEKLFARDPDLRPMFREDLAGQGMKFMSTLGTIIAALDAPDLLAKELQKLADGHDALGVEPEHYTVMREALLDTLAVHLGPDLTPQARAAWQTAYDQIAADMIAAADA